VGPRKKFKILEDSSVDGKSNILKNKRLGQPNHFDISMGLEN
jgi:hypothetical protein